MLAAIFPGQGSQKPTMGADLYANSDVARSLFQKANRELDLPLTEVMFAEADPRLGETLYTQLAIFVHSFIIATLLEADFDMAAGHSIGQFSALAAFGGLSFEDGLLLVRARAQAMQEAAKQNPGTMAAILGGSVETVTAICKEASETTSQVVVIANYNCPGQLMVSGTLEAVELACKLAQAAKLKTRRPPVSGAWHSPLMEPAQAPFVRAYEFLTRDFRTPDVPVYDNLLTDVVTTPSSWRSLLERQITNSVLWEQSIRNMIRDGASEFLELGPGKVLAGLVSRIDNNVSVRSIGTWDEVAAYNKERNGE